MAEEIDFNDALDSIVLSENSLCKESYDEGYKSGYEAGNPEGYHLGYHRGAELGRELGRYIIVLKNPTIIPTIYKIYYNSQQESTKECNKFNVCLLLAFLFKDFIIPGYYFGVVTNHIENKDSLFISEKVLKQLEKVRDLINLFPQTNSEDHDILNLAENIRAQYKRACALLRIPSSNPYDTEVSF